MRNAIFALLLSAAVTLALGPVVIPMLRRLKFGQSERSDGRTRFCIIRGGSYFTARGSQWYVDGGPRPANFATKFLLMWPGLDRCATIGFRCVVDLKP